MLISLRFSGSRSVWTCVCVCVCVCACSGLLWILGLPHSGIRDTREVASGMYYFHNDNDNDTSTVITVFTSAQIQKQVLRGSFVFFFGGLPLCVFALVSMVCCGWKTSSLTDIYPFSLPTWLTLVILVSRWLLKYSINGKVSLLERGEHLFEWRKVSYRNPFFLRLVSKQHNSLSWFGPTF